MKIGIDCRLWNETGIGRYIRNLVLYLQNLDQANEYILFCLSRDSSSIISTIHQKNFTLATADFRWHTIAEQIQFPKLLLQHNLDVMHFPYFSVPLFYSKPFIVTIHDLILHHFPTGEASTLSYPLYKTKLSAYKFLMQQISLKAKKIITVSNATKNEIIDHLHADSKKIEVIYEGVDKALKKSEKEKNDKEQPYFLYVGNVYPHKNTTILLKAFLLFLQKFPEYKLIFVGKEDFFYKRLKNKTYSNSHIAFMHTVSDKDLSSLYANTKAVVAPSLMEGFGLPGIEALANKALVVASDIPVYHEILGEVPFYFDPQDPESLRSAFEQVANVSKSEKEKRNEMGSKKIKEYSWQTMAEKTLRIYQQAVS